MNPLPSASAAAASTLEPSPASDRPLKSVSLMPPDRIMLSPLRFYPPQAAQVLVLADQLRQFETASGNEIHQAQRSQLRTLMQHAWQYSAFWRERLEAAGFDPRLTDTSSFQRMPPLQRRELQTCAEAMRAHWPGPDQKQIITATSSGSTGVPVRVETDSRTYIPLYSALSWTEGRWRVHSNCRSGTSFRSENGSANHKLGSRQEARGVCPCL